LGSAVAASILAGNTIDHGHTVLQAGYVDALWVGTAICALSAAASALLTRGGSAVGPGPQDDSSTQALAMEDAELGSAGLFGVEDEVPAATSDHGR
jgi:hypothetical protein